jgi:sigma-B regulation protein RsbU (phosphoserine phosphatase)
VPARGAVRPPGTERKRRRWSLLRASVVVAVLALALAGVAAGLLFDTASSLASAQRYQNRQLEPAQNDTTSLLADYLDQETGVRGYELAGQTSFLAPYRSAAGEIPTLEGRLRTLLSANPRTDGPLEAMINAYAAWSNDFAQPQLARVRQGRITAAQQAEEGGTGRDLFDDIRAQTTTLDTVLSDERRVSEAHVTSLQDHLETLLVVTLVLGALGIVAALAVAVRWVVRPLRGLAGAAQEVAGGRLHAEVPVAGTGELQDLAADLTAMRYRLLEEINRARMAGEALRLDGPTASALHDALTPRSDVHPDLVAVGRLDPAEGVLAGDWYDLLRIGDDLAVVVGDVSGHGPRSAVLALSLRAVVATRLLAGGSPGDALSVAAASITNGAPEQFATVFVAIIEPGAGTLRYASAGHPSALLAPERGASEELGPTGPFVSPIVARWSWSTLVQPFRPGDRLLVYTDGVTEGRNATKEEYGLDRLKADLVATMPDRPLDTVQVIAEHVDRFVGASQSDDRTLVYVVNTAAQVTSA